MRWGDVGAAVRDFVGGLRLSGGLGGWRRGVRSGSVGRGDADFEGVDFAVILGWSEGEAVFVADELGDLGVHRCVILSVVGEVDLAAGGVGEGAQQTIGFVETLCGEGRFRGGFLSFFFVGGFVPFVFLLTFCGL